MNTYMIIAKNGDQGIEWIDTVEADSKKEALRQWRAEYNGAGSKYHAIDLSEIVEKNNLLDMSIRQLSNLDLFISAKYSSKEGLIVYAGIGIKGQQAPLSGGKSTVLIQDLLELVYEYIYN